MGGSTEKAHERYWRRHGPKETPTESRKRRGEEGKSSGPIYNGPRMLIHCKVCAEVCNVYPSRLRRKQCEACEGPSIHCNLCGTSETPQWRKWRGFHCCNPCGIKQWRHWDSDYFKPMPGKTGANRASLTKKDHDGGLSLLQHLKDIGEL